MPVMAVNKKNPHEQTGDYRSRPGGRIQSGASSASPARADHRPYTRLLSSLAASTSTFALVASTRWSASAVTLPGIGPTIEEVLTAFVRGHAPATPGSREGPGKSTG
jgi:hypothetical protein